MIYGERVRLRSVERTDIPNFVTWLNDPDVTEGLMMYLPISTVEEERWFDGLANRPAEERPLAIDIRSGDDWVHVGNCGLFNIELNNRSAEAGIFIGDKTLWNKGYGTEVMLLLLKHGFETLNLNRVFLRVYETNPRAIHSYEKAGFIHEGRMRQGLYRRGKYHDILLMSILRKEWDALERA